jgi:archaellum component FlaC
MDADDATTKPTIETVLERINVLGESLHTDMKRIDGRIDKIDERLEKFAERFNELDDTLDRIESHTNKTRAEFLTLRSDFREWRDLLKGLLPEAR